MPGSPSKYFVKGVRVKFPLHRNTPISREKEMNEKSLLSELFCCCQFNFVALCNTLFINEIYELYRGSTVIYIASFMGY